MEAICQFFNTIGKQLDESPKSRRINDAYFSRLKELTTNPQLAPRLKFMVRDVLDLRSNNWVPRREEVVFFFFGGGVCGVQMQVPFSYDILTGAFVIFFFFR